MVRKITLFLLAILSLVLVGGCLSNLEDTTTMSISLTWDPAIGDCELGIIEPYKDTYYVDTVDNCRTPNGYFSYDDTEGGPETWTLKQNHQPGEYTPLVYSWIGNNTGEIHIKITINGIIGYGTEEIHSNEQLQFLNYSITRNASGGNLQYTLIRKKLDGRPPKGSQ